MKNVISVVRGLSAVIVTAVLLVGVPAMLAVWWGVRPVTDLIDVFGDELASDSRKIAAVLTFALVAAAWAAWLMIATALVGEIVGVVRGVEVHLPVVPVGFQRGAARLIAACTLLAAPFISTSVAAAPPPLQPVDTAASTLIVGPSGVAATPVAASTPAVSSPMYTVQRGDQWWSLAERMLGSGERWSEIVELNSGRSMPDGSTLTEQTPRPRPGWQLRLPADAAVSRPAVGGDVVGSETGAATGPEASVTAVTGDTVWDLTDEHYGRVDGPLVVQVAEASGLADPDVLMPGDVVAFPTVDATPTAARPGWNAHRVVTDDTLWDILDHSYGRVDADMVWTVASVNGIENPSLIFPGQTIELPPNDELTRLIAGEQPTAPALTPSPAAPAPNEAATSPMPPMPAPQQAAESPAATTEISEVAETSDVSAEQSATETAVDQSSEAATALPPPATATAPQRSVEAGAPLPPPTSAPLPDRSAEAATSAPSTVPAEPDRVVTSTPTSRSVGVAAVSDHDMLGSRWLFGAAAIGSLGLVGAWLSMRRLRQRRRRWLGLPERDPATVSAPSERESKARREVIQLADLVDHDLRVGNVRAALLGEVDELRFCDAAPEPPAGWALDGMVWRHVDGGVDGGVDGEADGVAARVLSPALVTIGSTDDQEVVLDLMTAGTVSMTGDRTAVERFACSMLWELASDPLGARVDLVVVGLACAAAEHGVNVARQLTLDEAVELAREPVGPAPQVFLVDPLEAGARVPRELVEACSRGSGRALVVTGPCEGPNEEIRVPSAQRAMWDDLSLTPPQLPEEVSVQLGRSLDALEVGGRERVGLGALSVDTQAEAVRLRSTVLVDEIDDEEVDEGDDFDAGFDRGFVAGGGSVVWADDVRDAAARGEPETSGDREDDVDGDRDGGGIDVVTERELVESADVDGTETVAVPEVMLTVCGSEIGVDGFTVGRAWVVLFVLSAAGRKMHTNEVAELTGYSKKSIFNAFSADHELVERADGEMWLSDKVASDHGWLRRCVAELAAVMEHDAPSKRAREWMMLTLDAVRAIEQAPYAVLPARAPTTKSKRSGWAWVDEFPADVPARQIAETELVESVLAFAELWMVDDGHEDVVRRSEMVGELCRVAGTVPFARVVRQLRPSQWDTGASCLLVAAARVADEDAQLVARVQQTARELAARELLEASDELADALGL